MDIVIIGNNVAGTYCAKALIELNPKNRITIFSNERYPFYSRIRLKEIIGSRSSPEDIIIFSNNWYKTNNINLILNSKVNRIIPADQTVIYSNNEQIKYDRLVIATGSNSRIPPIYEVNKNVFPLRSMAEALRIKTAIPKFKDCAIIGAGPQSLEIAGEFLKHGIKIKIIERAEQILSGMIDEEGSKIIQSIYERSGIDFYLNTQAKNVIDNKSKKEIEINNGQTLEVDFIQINTGILPNTYIAKSCGIKCSKGIIVDDLMQTSMKNIFAAGDACEHKNRLYGLWLPAKNQGELAASNIIGKRNEYYGDIRKVSLKTDIFSLISIGDILSSDINYRLKTSKESDQYCKIFLKENVIIGAIILNSDKIVPKIVKAIGEDLYSFKNRFDFFFKNTNSDN